MTEFTPSTEPKKKVSGCLISIIVVLVLLTGGIIAGFLIDQSNYEKANTFYLNGDCERAIPFFGKITDRFRLLDINKFKEISEGKLEECEKYQDVVDLEKSGDYDIALLGYLEYYQNKLSPILFEFARQRGQIITSTIAVTEYSSPDTCRESSSLLDNNFIVDRDATLPEFYYACAHEYLAINENETALSYQLKVLTNYPTSNAASTVITEIHSNPVICLHWNELTTIPVLQKKDVIPPLLKKCGMVQFDGKHWSDAVYYFEAFLENYPTHPLASEVKKYYAKALVNDTTDSGSGYLPPPSVSGSTTKGSAVVTIQNSTPYDIQVVFSGPEAKVEVISACSGCIKYSTAPEYCPTQGYTRTYTVVPGTYSIVVKVVNSINYIQPWSGSWLLGDGTKYEKSCFFIITR